MSPLRILAIVLCGVSALALALCLFTSGNDGLLLPLALASAAAAKGAQVACFGHTHKPFCEYRDGVLLINPGTCTLRGACALLTIDQSGSFQAELL